MSWDAIDFAILRALSADATLSAGALGRDLGLSQPATWRRIKRLQDEGVLAGRRVDLDAEALGFEACFFVLIRTSEHDSGWQGRFLKALKARPEVQEAHRLAGDMSARLPIGDRRLAHPTGRRQGCLR